MFVGVSCFVHIPITLELFGTIVLSIQCGMGLIA